MSVLIKGMKMPKSCSECGFECRAYCFLVDTVIESNDRPDWCPLVEVPTPHGRLVDCETLKDNLAVLFERNEILIDVWLVYAIDDLIDELPTIIEAEEE